MASAGSNDDGASAAAVCCMCGDHGFPGELFQCGLCLQRLQHRYCSDLYPRVLEYRSCNWCLRDEEGGGGCSPVKAPMTMAKQRASSRPTDSRDDNDKDDRPRGGCGECSRSAFPAELGKAVKKPKKSHKRAVLRSVATRAAKGRKVKASARKPPFRAKARVQRYKLLAEVISC